MTKLKITDEEFTRLYRDHSVTELAEKYGVCNATITYQAKKLGLFKDGKNMVAVEIIPGGLPHDSRCKYLLKPGSQVKRRIKHARNTRRS